eukprot:CAMPEP_0116916418 /NCGR_PEP_ID=MMETSP0467-20121206/18516_1 /TAXON_ID=283647 /ORGANISM="Mesodinium pulex, Strain SPMC105" /LENGTH=101 /DNA_ID=CAMNT_0004593277 /DNA_START=980 /DNA_END=1285 /DNA_ORIENTATION=-
MSQMNKINRTRGKVLTSAQEVVNAVSEQVSLYNKNKEKEDSKPDVLIENLVLDEVDKFCVNLNWGQYESITKIEIADSILQQLLTGSIEDVIQELSSHNWQ